MIWLLLPPTYIVRREKPTIWFFLGIIGVVVIETRPFRKGKLN